VIELTPNHRTGVVPTQRPWAPGLAFGILSVLILLLVSSVPPAAATAAASSALPVAAATHPSVGFNPICAPIVPGVCVSVQSATEPAIVPPAGTYNSPVEPSANQSLPLVIKSENPLNASNVASFRNGPDSPIILNVTGNLWDGAPYYSLDDGSVFHSATALWWDGPITTTNTTYPWWYTVNLSADSPTGQPNFFPGMSISWSIEITYNVSGNYVHEGSPQSNPPGPVFHFTYRAAWPYSPDAGSAQYDGAAAYDQDLTTTRVPSQPNWNDSVTLTLNTTPQDTASGAGIGLAYVDLTETSVNGTPIAYRTFTYGNASTAGTEIPKVHFLIPAAYAQQAGASVRYTIYVEDAWGDTISSGVRNYTVGGNGSFVVGQFGDDLALTSSPSVALPIAPLAPGTPVALALQSENSGTAIASATVFYTVDLPQLNEVTAASFRMSRINSTSFAGTIPGFPVGSGVNFTVEAWDFDSLGETSPDYNYSVQSVATALPAIAQNGSFFYVGVRNAGSGAWIDGATVRVIGPGGYFRSVGTTYAGLAYPNATAAPYAPIVVPAGQTYVVNVSDASDRSAGVALANGVAINLSTTHAMAAHAVLDAGNGFTVYQDGNLIVFWFNSTAPAPSASSPDTTPIVIGSVVGLVAAVLILFPLLGWWRRIQQRRAEETKRVTL
jgi:hypothetical protein